MLEKLLDKDRILLDLQAKKKKEVLLELCGALGLSDEKQRIIIDALLKRESIGSTGIGKGIAIPHTRSLVLDKVHLVLGRSKNGVDFDALDGKPVYLFFLLCAPPQDPGTIYLLTLGKIAQIARKLSKSKDYMELDDPEDFLKHLISLEGAE
jgi:mannitol/fructose-specific phosphotransferase system IIA component (Ntr-type)